MESFQCGAKWRKGEAGKEGRGWLRLGLTGQGRESGFDSACNRKPWEDFKKRTGA